MRLKTTMLYPYDWLVFAAQHVYDDIFHKPLKPVRSNLEQEDMDMCQVVARLGSSISSRTSIPYH